MRDLYAIRDSLSDNYVHTNRSGIILVDAPIVLYCKDEAEELLERCEGLTFVRPSLVSFNQLIEECRAENESDSMEVCDARA